MAVRGGSGGSSDAFAAGGGEGRPKKLRVATGSDLLKEGIEFQKRQGGASVDDTPRAIKGVDGEMYHPTTGKPLPEDRSLDAWKGLKEYRKPSKPGFKGRAVSEAIATAQEGARSGAAGKQALLKPAEIGSQLMGHIQSFEKHIGTLSGTRRFPDAGKHIRNAEASIQSAKESLAVASNNYGFGATGQGANNMLDAANAVHKAYGHLRQPEVRNAGGDEPKLNGSLLHPEKLIVAAAQHARGVNASNIPTKMRLGKEVLDVNEPNTGAAVVGVLTDKSQPAIVKQTIKSKLKATPKASVPKAIRTRKDAGAELEREQRKQVANGYGKGGAPIINARGESEVPENPGSLSPNSVVFDAGVESAGATAGARPFGSKGSRPGIGAAAKLAVESSVKPAKQGTKGAGAAKKVSESVDLGNVNRAKDVQTVETVKGVKRVAVGSKVTALTPLEKRQAEAKGAKIAADTKELEARRQTLKKQAQEDRRNERKKNADGAPKVRRAVSGTKPGKINLEALLKQTAAKKGK